MRTDDLTTRGYLVEDDLPGQRKLVLTRRGEMFVTYDMLRNCDTETVCSLLGPPPTADQVAQVRERAQQAIRTALG